MNLKINQCVEEFWRCAGELEQFPRTLEIPILRALPLAIVKIPRLGLEDIRNWLSHRQIVFNVAHNNRRLRACLVAAKGRGLIFVDGSDPDNERRFSLAHETAHFMCDYLIPRRRTIELFGIGIEEVLDGLRPPTHSEHLSGILAGISIGIHSDLMYRGRDGMAVSIELREIEDRADRVALELLAPRKSVFERLSSQQLAGKYENDARVAAQILAEEFGLPDSVATRYGTLLIAEHRPIQSFRDWLGV